MSTTIATFSDSLLQSGVLAPHANLTQRTRETLETCLRLAQKANTAEEAELGDCQPEEQTPQKTDPTVDLARQQHSNQGHHAPPSLCPPLTPSSTADTEVVSYMDFSAFMDQLHLAILYRGYMTLTNATISADRVRQKFRLLYPAMGRDHLASYFAAALHAKISRIDLDKQWRSVPFFQLGGAGTHYAWPPEVGPYTRRSRHWQAISVPLSHFSADLQQDLNGDWFDMQDLECFLLERKIQFVAASGAADSQEHPKAEPQTLTINARNLIAGMGSMFVVFWCSLLTDVALLHKTMCLGRSAGFRRTDVESALQRAVLV
jgi:hypothetical protein